MSIVKKLYVHGEWVVGPDGPEWKGPDNYHCTEPFIQLAGDLYWTLGVYAHFYRHIHSSFAISEQELDKQSDKLEAERSNIEDRGMWNLSIIRRMDSIFAENMDIQKSSRAINRMLVVALWALAEQNLGRVYRQIISIRSNIEPESVKAPYRWDEIKKSYLSEKIDLSQLDDYAIADECRVLNNNIKHSRLVSNTLAKFPMFKTHFNKNLDNISIDIQRYFSGIANFLGNLMESELD